MSQRWVMRHGTSTPREHVQYDIYSMIRTEGTRKSLNPPERTIIQQVCHQYCFCSPHFFKYYYYFAIRHVFWTLEKRENCHIWQKSFEYCSERVSSSSSSSNRIDPRYLSLPFGTNPFRETSGWLMDGRESAKGQLWAYRESVWPRVVWCGVCEGVEIAENYYRKKKKMGYIDVDFENYRFSWVLHLKIYLSRLRFASFILCEQ